MVCLEVHKALSLFLGQVLISLDFKSIGFFLHMICFFVVLKKDKVFHVWLYVVLTLQH